MKRKTKVTKKNRMRRIRKKKRKKKKRRKRKTRKKKSRILAMRLVFSGNRRNLRKNSEKSPSMMPIT